MFHVIKLGKLVRNLIIIIAIMFFGLKIFSFFYPTAELDLISEYCDKNNLDMALVCAIIHTESKFNSGATSYKNASGYMQIIEQTANWGAEQLGMDNFTYDQITDPETNIKIGTWYIKKLINQFGNVDTALAAYNAGSGTVDGWLKDPKYSSDGKTLKLIPYGETQRYVKKVNTNEKIYNIILKIKGMR